jgi:hypothetical protein
VPDFVANISVRAHITAVAHNAVTDAIAYATTTHLFWCGNIHEVPKQFDVPGAVAIAFSPDGGRLAYATGVGQLGVISIDPPWQRQVHGLDGHRGGPVIGIGWLRTPSWQLPVATRARRSCKVGNNWSD